MEEVEIRIPSCCKCQREITSQHEGVFRDRNDRHWCEECLEKAADHALQSPPSTLEPNSPEPDAEEVERVARLLFDTSQKASDCPPRTDWLLMTENHRRYWRTIARAAIAPFTAERDQWVQAKHNQLMFCWGESEKLHKKAQEDRDCYKAALQVIAYQCYCPAADRAREALNSNAEGSAGGKEAGRDHVG